jgi:hypothetical protein
MAGKERPTGIPQHIVKGTADVLRRIADLAGTQLHAVLATVAGERPYTSLVACALAPGGKGVLFATARETRKYRNLLGNPRVSVLIDTRVNSGQDYLTAESLTIEGTARPLRRGARRDRMAGIFLRRHPALREFLAGADTALVLVEPEQVVHVGHFQEVTIWKADAGENDQT